MIKRRGVLARVANASKASIMDILIENVKTVFHWFG